LSVDDQPSGVETVTSHGVAVPALGLGTYPMTGDSCRTAVGTALELGYRHVDTAQMYDNEAAVGDAIAASPVPREEVFVVTKLDRGNLGHGDVLTSTRESRRRLGVDTVDLLLIHAPGSVPVAETIGAMNELQAAGEVAHVGVSNFSVAQLRAAIEASNTPVVTNQVKYNPYRDRSDLLAYCVEQDVILTAYTPLAAGRVADDDELAAIGESHGKSPTQVALRWLLQQQLVAAIPKASSRAHLAENIDVFDFELTDAEMRQVFERQGGLADRVRSLLGL
jgi:diketogulonate reductase-like aldo/keto reductase